MQSSIHRARYGHAQAAHAVFCAVLVLAFAATPRRAAAQAGDNVLGALVAELERQNPDLQAARREIDRRAALVAPAGALPDPMLSAGSMTGFARPPFFPSSITPEGFQQIGLSQAFPYPGKRALRTSIATSEADAARWTYEATRRSLVADLKHAYLDYVLSMRALDVVADSKVLIDQLRQIAETRFSVGKGPQQDVIKAQLEVSKLIEQQTMLREQAAASVSRLNALLNRPQDAPPPPAGAYTTAPLPQDAAALRALIDTNDPAIQREAAHVDAGQHALALARKDLRPDVQVGVTAQRFAGEMPWMYGIDLSVTFPAYASRKQRPLVAEAGASLDVAARTRDSARASAAAEVTQAFVAMTAADQLAALYGDSVLPQARLALESSLASYQVGAVDFLSVLTNFDAVFSAERSQIEQQVRRDQALVRLEAIVGVVFVQ